MSQELAHPFGIDQGTAPMVSTRATVVDAGHIRDRPVGTVVQQVRAHRASGLLWVEGLSIGPVDAQQSGVHQVACTMTMDLMGIKREELIDGVEEGGVAAYLDKAGSANMNLFIG